MDELKTSYEKGWNSIYIHVDLPVPYEENYHMKMLKNNMLPHLACISGSGRDGTSRYSFRSEGGILMEEKYRSRDIRAEEILAFTEQLAETADSLTEHMLNPDRILLAPEMIFAEEQNFQFCYLPAESGMALGEAFHKMTEYFVGRLDYTETDGILLVYRLHKETMQNNYDLKKIIEEYKREAADYREVKKGAHAAREAGAEEKEHSRRNQEKENSHRTFPEGTVFFCDEEEKTEKYSPEKKISCIKEKAVSYGPVRKMINKIKTGRWGEWEDLITEIDGQDRTGHL